jgi:hypothetical protein
MKSTRMEGYPIGEDTIKGWKRRLSLLSSWLSLLLFSSNRVSVSWMHGVRTFDFYVVEIEIHSNQRLPVLCRLVGRRLMIDHI